MIIEMIEGDKTLQLFYEDEDGFCLVITEQSIMEALYFDLSSGNARLLVGSLFPGAILNPELDFFDPDNIAVSKEDYTTMSDAMHMVLQQHKSNKARAIEYSKTLQTDIDVLECTIERYKGGSK